MPLLRRRPLLRAAMVGGAGYAIGRRATQTGAGPGAPEQQSAEPAPSGSSGATPISEAERIQALGKLKELFDSGVLTEEEFGAQKRKLLQG